ncbi:hypothetical protein D9M71_714180 [compost metagenome]
MGGLLGLLGEHTGEVQVASLVVRGIGVGDVVGQHLAALGAEAEGLLMDAEGLFETDAHGPEPLPVAMWVACQIFSKGRATFIFPLFSMS